MGRIYQRIPRRGRTRWCRREHWAWAVQSHDLELSYDGTWVPDAEGVVSPLSDPAMAVTLPIPGGRAWQLAWDVDGCVLVVTSAESGYQVVDCTVGGRCVPVSPVSPEGPPPLLVSAMSIDVTDAR